MKIILIGGHLSPALAVAQSLKKDDILFIGRKHALEGDKALSLEYQAVNSLGIPFVEINTGRLQRKFTRYTFVSFLKTPLGFSQSLGILKRYNPDVVLGFGGYVSVPVVLAARVLKIPVIIHEQTLEAGAANKFASRFAKKVCISWESSRKFFPQEKVVLTGNPVRSEIQKISNFPSASLRAGKFQISNSHLPTVYVTGGSLGSHAINVLIENCLEDLLKIAQVIHQTGDAKKFQDFYRLKIVREKLNDNLRNRYQLEKFINPSNVGAILNKSDMVISRSGINTITELIFLKKPSFLIPLSLGQKNEQEKNALFMKKLGLAQIADEKDLFNGNFFEKVSFMLKNLDNFKQNEDFGKIIEKNAAGKIINVLKSSVNIND